jgi:argininosuccinate synthase
VLAYTGGLYTLTCVHWLRHERGFQVITYSSDLGQGERLQAAGEEALATGAEAAHIGDVRLAFVTDYIFPALRAHARYESGYLLGTALSRPLIAKELVKLAREEGCEYIAHAAGHERNDAIRFERCIHALAPDIKVICPPDEWRMKTREQLLAYAQRARLSVAQQDPLPAAYDRNLWGASVRWFDEHDTWAPPPEDIFQMTTSPQIAPDLPTAVDIEFYEGVPVRLNGVNTQPLELIARLNKLGGDNAVGRIDTVEEDISGRKTRELYEAPAALILYRTHNALENLVMPHNLIRCKESLAREYANIIFQGSWFEPLRECLDAFFARSQQHVTGKVRIQLFKGNCTVVGRQSPFALTRQPPEKPTS